MLEKNKLPNRKPTRLKEYNYSNHGYYFITICTKGNRRLFGEITDSRIILNQFGKIIEECWQDLPNHYPNCELDYYVIMADHFHGILVLDNRRERSKTLPYKKHYGLSEIIRGFKSFSARKINNILDSKERFHWQRSFYDRIIRNEKELYQIRKYITQNPMKWEIEKGISENLIIQ